MRLPNGLQPAHDRHHGHLPHQYRCGLGDVNVMGHMPTGLLRRRRRCNRLGKYPSRSLAAQRLGQSWLPSTGPWVNFQFELKFWLGSEASFAAAAAAGEQVADTGWFTAGPLDLSNDNTFEYMPSVVLPRRLPGNANLDGKVDVNDLTIVLANFGQTRMAWPQGDFNGDGRVDVNDLTIVLSNYGHSLGSSAAGSCLRRAGTGPTGLVGRGVRRPIGLRPGLGGTSLSPGEGRGWLLGGTSLSPGEGRGWRLGGTSLSPGEGRGWRLGGTSLSPGEGRGWRLGGTSLSPGEGRGWRLGGTSLSPGEGRGWRLGGTSLSPGEGRGWRLGGTSLSPGEGRGWRLGGTSLSPGEGRGWRLGGTFLSPGDRYSRPKAQRFAQPWATSSDATRPRRANGSAHANRCHIAAQSPRNDRSAPSSGPVFSFFPANSCPVQRYLHRRGKGDRRLLPERPVGLASTGHRCEAVVGVGSGTKGACPLFRR